MAKSKLFIEEEKKFRRSKKLGFDMKSLFPVVPASKLLSSIQHQKLLSDIESRVNLPKKYYRILYEKLIFNFVDLVQSFPASLKTLRWGSLLEEGLRRALFALQIQQEEGDGSNLLDDYVLFSAALLFDVAIVSENRSVIMTDKKGVFLKKWLPLYEGALVNKAGYCRIRCNGGYSPALSRRITPLYAFNLLPKPGLKWIAERPQILNNWLALLSDDYAESGGYRRILNRAQELLEDFIANENYELPVEVELVESDFELGDEFSEWLSDGIENGDISVNDPNGKIQIIDGQLFLTTPGVFQEFADYKQLGDWQTVYEQFRNLGYESLNEDYILQQNSIRESFIQNDSKAKEDNTTLFNRKKDVVNKGIANVGRAAALGTFIGSAIIKEGSGSGISYTSGISNSVLLTPDATSWLAPAQAQSANTQQSNTPEAYTSFSNSGMIS
ncbi:MAG: hypothetical protein AMJ43_01920 [Coxiella sp. DG_40]|nr:MAG: hypothetical protein AMJ43_01920 [Coxiella sp. DG_40]